jgi:hypothetical protein
MTPWSGAVIAISTRSGISLVGFCISQRVWVRTTRVGTIWPISAIWFGIFRFGYFGMYIKTFISCLGTIREVTNKRVVSWSVTLKSNICIDTVKPAYRQRARGCQNGHSFPFLQLGQKVHLTRSFLSFCSSTSLCEPSRSNTEGLSAIRNGSQTFAYAQALRKQ